jgi:hypothetical protein
MRREGRYSARCRPPAVDSLADQSHARVDGSLWPDSAGSQLSAIAAAEAAALTRELAIASEEYGRLNLQQETNGREPAAPCTRFFARICNRPESPRSRPACRDFRPAADTL